MTHFPKEYTLYEKIVWETVCRQEDNIKTDFQRVKCGDKDRTELAVDRERR
jgi:hypothetical protein